MIQQKESPYFEDGNIQYNSMGECKKDVTPLLTHWSYVFLALNHRINFTSN